ncbi:M56 family metallopeptidase [Mariniflexile litorale]|uniref:M56 family metallopeptidase n=1 Tax=Mariniflexile litorale TaxID=3045158 RepID=A0AAU7ECQ1_9FLAO|nr:M56 family metallopeptidase [Mariniflexile sp. KMM 9835]MDQ8212623.1 M56 family metallopeptidase [Mariniflexile sp. KMM 9835]
MEYLLKTSAVITIFYLCYKLFLQRDTFFEFNRVFLLLGILTGFLIPFVVIPIYIEYTPIDLSNFTTDAYIASETIEESFKLLDLISIIYVLGVIVFSIRFVVQLISLSRVIIKNKREKQSHFTIITTTNNILPFSYFKWIVLNPALFNKEELKQIIAHEIVHVKQYHSIDNILTQLACIVLWFNPFIWLYNKDLKQNLEFIADQNAQKETNCKKSYQYTLLKTSMPKHQLAITNNFYNSLIKKRIVMLHKSKSKKINQLKYALVIPLLALFLMSCNTKKIYVKVDTPFEKLENDTTLLKRTSQKISGIVTNKEGLGLPGVNIIIEGKNKSTVTNFDGDYIIEAEKEDILIISFKGMLTQKITVDTITLLNIQLQPENTKTQTRISERDTDTIKLRNKNNPNSISDNLLFIINGKESKKSEFDKLNSENIKKIDILKGEAANKAYGDKGKNGVIIITTKGKASDIKVIEYSNASDSNKNIKIGHKIEIDSYKQPLIIVDSKELPYEKLKNIKHNNIKSMNVIKDEKAIEKNGVKGINGVIEITTENNKWQTEFIVHKPMADVVVSGYEKKLDSINHDYIRIKATSTTKGESPLIIVDGKKISNKK